MVSYLSNKCLCVLHVHTHTEVSSNTTDNKKCTILSSLSAFFPVFAVCHGVELGLNSKVPYVFSLSLFKIGRRVTQEVHASASPALICDLLWTLTSTEPRDKPRGRHDEHKPGSGRRLILIQRFFCRQVWRSEITFRDHLNPAPVFRVDF